MPSHQHTLPISSDPVLAYEPVKCFAICNARPFKGTLPRLASKPFHKTDEATAEASAFLPLPLPPLPTRPRGLRRSGAATGEEAGGSRQLRATPDPTRGSRGANSVHLSKPKITGAGRRDPDGSHRVTQGPSPPPRLHPPAAPRRAPAGPGGPIPPAPPCPRYRQAGQEPSPMWRPAAHLPARARARGRGRGQGRLRKGSGAAPSAIYRTQRLRKATPGCSQPGAAFGAPPALCSNRERPSCDVTARVSRLRCTAFSL